ncbi:MAG: AEC family transporter [Lachnospiraceae bacterium]|nr:AEC family transporter [Lachnospiraceae bacterium]
MKLTDLFSLQGTLFAMMLIGAWMKKRGIISEEGKRCLSDLCINVVIPCNIFKSCLIDLEPGVLKNCALLILSAVLLQLLCLLLNLFLFNRYEDRQKKVLQYCTIVPMSGFLGNPIAEGLYSSIGVLYTSIFLIPMRIIMWSVGTTYFVSGAVIDKKKLIKNVLTHPCLVAIYLGVICMITQVSLPKILTETLRYVGNCNSALTMFIVGTILADVRFREILNKDTLLFSVLRLILLPAAAFGLGSLLRLDSVSLGVSVLMTGMPAGATAAIFAARYNSDAPFATKCVVTTTLLSMLTLPLWSWLAG